MSKPPNLADTFVPDRNLRLALEECAKCADAAENDAGLCKFALLSSSRPFPGFGLVGHCALNKSRLRS